MAKVKMHWWRRRKLTLTLRSWQGCEMTWIERLGSMWWLALPPSPRLWPQSLMASRMQSRWGSLHWRCCKARVVNNKGEEREPGAQGRVCTKKLTTIRLNKGRVRRERHAKDQERTLDRNPSGESHHFACCDQQQRTHYCHCSLEIVLRALPKACNNNNKK